MTAHVTEVRTLGPGTIVRVEDLGPTERATIMFLANRKPSTMLAYKHDLAQYWAWCEGIPIPPLAVDKIHVQMYLDHLQARGLAQATVARRFNTVRLLLKLAYEEELIDRDPTRRITCPKVDRERQRRSWFTTLDMAMVIREAHTRPLDHALLFFMNVTAMRVGEVTQLDVASIHRDPGRVWIGFVGKGDVYAEIDLDYATIATVDRYLAGRADGPLFLNAWGNRLTRENVQTILNRSCRNCGITYPVTPHTLRRTHAMTAAEQGADLFSIGEDLRHKDLKTTKMYVGKRTGRGSRAQRLVSDLMVQMTTPVGG